MRALLVLLLVPNLARAHSESNEERAKESDQEGLFTSAGMSFTFDDNVHRLSSRDMQQFHLVNQGQSDANQARFDRMLTITDTIYREDAGLYEQSKPFGDGFAGRLGADLEYVKYYYNTIKDHPYLKPYIRQYFTDKHYLEISFSNSPNQFERNYIGRASLLRRPGDFYTRAWRWLYDGRFAAFGGIDGSVWAEYSWDRYAEPELDYRNAVACRYGGSVSHWWLPWLYTEGGYRYQYLRAVGAGFLDRSDVDHEWHVTFETKPWEDLRVTGGYRGSFTHYLTHYPLTVDPNYAGRRDFIDVITLGAWYPLGDNWTFWAQVERSDKRTNIHDVPSDEFLRYTQDTYSLGVRTKWGFGWLTMEP